MSTKERIQLIIENEDPGTASELIHESFVIIPKRDLPEFKVIERNGKQHVDCGSDWGTWDVTHVDRMRTAAIDYVGAWLTAEKWHAEQADEARSKAQATIIRRDELAAEYTPFGTYNAQPDYGKKFINRIIELERKAS